MIIIVTRAYGTINPRTFEKLWNKRKRAIRNVLQYLFFRSQKQDGLLRRTEHFDVGSVPQIVSFCCALFSSTCLSLSNGTRQAKPTGGRHRCEQTDFERSFTQIEVITFRTFGSHYWWRKWDRTEGHRSEHMQGRIFEYHENFCICRKIDGWILVTPSARTTIRCPQAACCGPRLELWQQSITSRPMASSHLAYTAGVLLLVCRFLSSCTTPAPKRKTRARTQVPHQAIIGICKEQNTLSTRVLVTSGQFGGRRAPSCVV